MLGSALSAFLEKLRSARPVPAIDPDERRQENAQRDRARRRLLEAEWRLYER